MKTKPRKFRVFERPPGTTPQTSNPHQQSNPTTFYFYFLTTLHINGMVSSPLLDGATFHKQPLSTPETGKATPPGRIDTILAVSILETWFSFTTLLSLTQTFLGARQ